MRDASWIDRCVGARDRVSLEPEQLTAAVAAATVVARSTPTASRAT